MNKYDIIILSGGFDPLHVGHIRMMKHAAFLAKEVLVAVNSDEWLVRNKGFNFMKLSDRLELVKSVKWITDAFKFNDRDNTAKDAISKIYSKYPGAEIAFGNGGIDRSSPESKLCEMLQVHQIWELGGDKIQPNLNFSKETK